MQPDLDQVKRTDNSNDDEYRVKVEALRQEFGSNWLSALNEQGWHTAHQIEAQQGQQSSHLSMHQGKMAITSSGRTLG